MTTISKTTFETMEDSNTNILQTTRIQNIEQDSSCLINKQLINNIRIAHNISLHIEEVEIISKED